ncbi:MAG: hypothetical protein ACOCQX_02410 [Candidatus Nanoarchaeia archaeon]
MIKEIFMYPALAILFLGFASQLMEIAESTSEKSVDFAYDMQNAVDCATKGVDMNECSPGLYEYEFDREMEDTIEANQQFIENIEKEAAKENITISEKDGMLIIK